MSIQLIERAREHGPRLAVVDAHGEHTYEALLDGSSAMASAVLAGGTDLAGERVCFLMPRSASFVHALLGVWHAGGIAVPLSELHPGPELEHVIADSGATTVLTHPTLVDRVEAITASRKLRLVTVAGETRSTRSSGFVDPVSPEPSAELHRIGALRDHRQKRPGINPGPTTRNVGPGFIPGRAVRRIAGGSPDTAALMLYTSGSTGKPKGVVLTHANLVAQITTLVEAWEWSEDDRILHVLPLHHTHGLVNALCCALWTGATCEMARRFDPDPVWQRLSAGGITLFMAVPTIYVRLIRIFEAEPPGRQTVLREAVGRLRLMVSGSAPLPKDVFERWRRITGQVLLERYGMTEIGMALSNPLHGERRPGCVGAPLPRVEVRLVNDDGVAVDPATPGELQVRGPAVFQEYWRRPDETRKSFHDGWFATGDEAVYDNHAYRILGRRSVDIIKSGGYKISALEIEGVLRGHAAVADCAVVGIDDADLGQRICAAVVASPGRALNVDELQRHARAQLARYKVPSRVVIVTDLPRNAMGKVQKHEVRKLFE